MQQRSRQYLLAGELMRAVDWSKNATQLKTISFVFITFCSPVTADTEAYGTQMGIPRNDRPNYGVPEGAPAICHEKARNEDAVRSMAGSTVE